MKRFIITKGGIARVMSAEDFVTDPMAEVAKWAAHDRAEVTSARPLAAWTDLPADKIFKDAWIDTGSAVVHDMSKAKAICKARREADGKPKKDAEIDAATTIEQLIALLT